MSLRSTTGQWAVESGPTLIGPFDGRGPAAQFASAVRRAVPGVSVTLRRLHAPSDALTWARQHASLGPQPPVSFEDELHALAAGNRAGSVVPGESSAGIRNP